MSYIAYYRVLTTEQSIETQRAAPNQAHNIDQEFKDEGVSGAVLAADRPGFNVLLQYVREGDTLHV